MSNLLKSIYISTYITLLTIAFVHSLFGFNELGFKSIWLGIAVATWPALFFFVRLFLLPTARTSENLNGLIITAIAGAVTSYQMALTPEQKGLAIVYGAGLGIIGLMLYIFWYSRLGRQPNKVLEVGHQLPEFGLKTSNGEMWSSTDLTQHPALMLFFRGNWCPLCMAQIKEVAASYQQLEKMGVNVFLISPQPEKNTQELAKKFDVNYHFMVDAHNRAAKILGIESKQGTPKGMEVLGYESDTVLPTAILTDKKGKIIFTDQTDNYRVRPEPDTFLRVFEEHGFTA